MKLVIVTSIFNETSRLNTLLEALLCQTDKDFYHYIIDDGSTIRECHTIVEDYIEKAKNKTVFITSSHLGVDLIHAECFRRIYDDLGEDCFFSWIDADDSVKPSFIAAFKRAIYSRPSFDVFHCNARVFLEGDDLGDVYSRFRMYEKRNCRRREQLASIYYWKGFHYGHFFVSMKTYHRLNPSFFFFDGRENFTCFYDNQIMYLLAINKCRFRYIADDLSIWNQSKNSFSSSHGRWTLDGFNHAICEMLAETTPDKIDFFKDYIKAAVYDECISSLRKGDKNKAELVLSWQRKFIQKYKVPTYYFWKRKRLMLATAIASFPLLGRLILRSHKR